MAIERVIKRDGSLVPFNREKISFAVFSAAVAVGGRDRALAEAVAGDAVRRLEADHGAEASVEEIQDAVEKALIERGHARTAKAYILYRYERALRRAGQGSLTYGAENIPYKKLWEALDWAVGRGCLHTAEIRAIAGSGGFPALVADSERRYAEEIALAGRELAPRAADTRVVVIAGPSSSGKTTATIKVGEVLAAAGKSLKAINVDNYFFDRESHPRDPWGDYDYETPQALDVARLSADIASLLAGKETRTPRYDFRTGKRGEDGPVLRLGADEVLLVDSLHGLHGPMTEAVPAGQKFRVYVETLAQLKTDGGSYARWADVRMLRRMSRDTIYRNNDPRETLLHWYLVRRAELRYIIPRLREADVVLNTYLPYELPIMKARLGRLFPRFRAELAAVPERADARDRAERVAALLDELPEWTDESVVPSTSPLREFIGGSGYAY